jgi:hypothetical protein
VQDAYGTPGAAVDLGANELIGLDVVGYTLRGVPTILNSRFLTNVFTFFLATVPGQTYQVQSASSLAQGDWHNVGLPFVAADLTAAITDTNATSQQQFYRVTVAKPVTTMLHRAASPPLRTAETDAPLETVPVIHRFLPREQ